MDQERLRESTVVGVRWLVVTRVVSETIGMAAIVALARLVTPAAFGHGAIALIFVMLATILTFEGFSSALVQREEVTDADRSTAMLMSIVAGVILTAIVFGLSGPVWQPIFGAKTAFLIRLVSPTMFIASLGGVSRSMIWRNLDFRTAGGIDAVSLLVASVGSVLLAALGDGATAIAVGGLIQTTTTTALLMIASRPPVPRWHRASQKKITSFGTASALAGMVAVALQNVDYAILAARLSATTVGLYYRAFNLSVVYQDKISRIMTQIAFPVYARTESRSELRNFHERVARVHALVIFPFLASICALAPVLIPFMFGHQWDGAIRPTEILGVAGGTSAILTGYPQVMLAIGKPEALLRFNAFALVLYAATVYAASSHGIVVVAAAVSAEHLVILICVYQFVLGPHVDIRVGRLIPELGPAVAGCGVLVGTDIGLRYVLSGAPDFVVAVVAGLAGVAAYALIIWACFPRAWNDLVTLITRVVPPTSRFVRPSRRTSMLPSSSRSGASDAAAEDLAAFAAEGLLRAMPAEALQDHEALL